jgi:hypothetical protein
MMTSDFAALQEAGFQLASRVVCATGKLLHSAASLGQYPAAGARANPVRAQFTLAILKELEPMMHRPLVSMIEAP